MKNYLTRLLSLAIESIPNKWVYDYFNNIVPIFMLHRLSNECATKEIDYLSHVEWCLNYLRKYHYNPISLDHLVYCYENDIHIDPKTVVFTIDDGFYDHYELAGPLFSKYDIPLTCFVITDFIDGILWPWDDHVSYILNSTKITNFELILPEGKKLLFKNDSSFAYENINVLRSELKLLDNSNMYAWIDACYEKLDVEKLATPPDFFKPMSWSDAQNFIDSGHKIAPHTKTHRILSRLNLHDSNIEISHSKERVQTMLNNSSNVFAYPTGRTLDFSTRDVDIVKQHDFSFAVTAEPGYSTKNLNNFTVPRFTLPNNKFDFIQYLSFFEAFKQHTKSKFSR